MIAPSAFVHPSAQIGKGTSIGPGAYIGADVVIGADCEIHHHATILGPLIMGDRNRVFQYASLGEEPQDLGYRAEPTQVVIGDENVFREGMTIHRGTVKGGGVTRIGNHNYCMIYSHIAHDCLIGNHIILTNYAALSGHVEVGDHAIMGAYCAAHQFARVGAYAFLSHGALISQDAPPFMTVVGGGAPFVIGVNARGLVRKGFLPEEIAAIKRLHRLYYRSPLSQQEALTEIESNLLPLCPQIQLFLDFVKNSQRGILRKSQ